MKKNFKKNLVIGLVISLGVVTFGLTKPVSVLAADAPDLGIASGYSVYGHTGLTNDGDGTQLWGKVGDNNKGHVGLLDTQAGSGEIVYGAEVESPVSSAYDALTGGTASDKNLHGSQIVTPGVYTVKPDETLSGTITLSGSGVYIFRSATAYTVDNGAQIVLTNGACASNVFWAVGSAMTIGTYAHLEGTIIAATELISLNTGTTLKGRAFSLLAQVTLLGNKITEPTCAAVSSGSNNPATINVVKVVINDSGRTKTVADFHLFVNDTPVVSGETNVFRAPASAYYVTETPDPNYTHTFSGDCDANGGIGLSPGDNKFCIITNNDIGIPAVTPPVAPIIDVVKVPSPLALPNGPGLVNYTYTVRNIGTVPMTNITMVGDTCSPIALASGDTNSDDKLDLNETWVYRCSTTLLETHTNTVVATGWANGLSAVDIASATVIVGMPIVHPLIHVTKVPSPLALLNGGGVVTYTEKISNPGTVALSNVTLVDDKCSPMKYISGDLNKDSKLDTTETWTYTCQTKLAKTTTNTAIASGTANGFTVRDFAIATVVVAAPAPVVPKLPNTGVNSQTGNTPWNIVIPAGVVLLATAFLLLVLKKRKV